MRFSRWLAIAVLATTGAGISGLPASAATGVPEATQSIQKTVKQLKKALKSGKCQVLGKVLQHSSNRVDPNEPAKPVKPTAKFTPDECTSIKKFADGLDGFKAQKSQAYGAGAIVQGTKDDAQYVITFALDVDGKYRAVSAGPLGAQIGTTTTLDFDGSLTAWLAAVKSSSCPEIWRLLTADSPYVVSRAFAGGADKLCTDLTASIQRASGRTYDVSQATATPTEFAALQDIGIYGLETPSGRFVTIIMYSEPGAEATHANPGVFEYVTSSSPTS